MTSSSRSSSSLWHDVGDDGGAFCTRHVGPGAHDVAGMLRVVGADTLDSLMAQTVPGSIRLDGAMGLGAGVPEHVALARLRAIADENRVLTSLIGQGYYGTILPGVIQRNVLENPAWYTAYTPYQPEISQGRLEALLNFQTLVMELTGLDVANASLLDEARRRPKPWPWCDAWRKAGQTPFLLMPTATRRPLRSSAPAPSRWLAGCGGQSRNRSGCGRGIWRGVPVSRLIR